MMSKAIPVRTGVEICTYQVIVSLHLRLLAEKYHRVG